MVEKDPYGYVTPCRLGDPIVGKDQNGFITLPSRGPQVGKDQSGYITPTFKGVPMLVKDESSYIIAAFSGVPTAGKDQSGYANLAFSGVPIVGQHEQETKRCLFSMLEWCMSIEPFSPTLTPTVGGSIDPPGPPS